MLVLDPMLSSLLVFSATIILIVTGVIDRVVSVIIGVLLMVLLGIYSPIEAFSYIDWNIITILFGMWVIVEYMVEAGIPTSIIERVIRKSDFKRIMIGMMLVSGFLSMFVDNVLVVLLFGTIAIRVCRKLGISPVKPVLCIALSSNFMGTALLMGDLPPQMLHSIAGAEFLDFIWMKGRPSSMIVLSLSFVITTFLFSRLMTKEVGHRGVVVDENYKSGLNRGLTALTLAFFVLTIFLMSIRQLLGVPLGFITVVCATGLALSAEVLTRLNVIEAPSFESIVEKLEWKALLFYIGLFSLVGGLDASGFIDAFASKLSSALAMPLPLGFTLLYWSSAFASSVVEHDAFLLAMFLTVRDAASAVGVDPWPYNWALAWGGTLGSNATMAGAPTLYVAYTLLRREGVEAKSSEIHFTSILYTLISTLVTYPIGLLLWAFL